MVLAGVTVTATVIGHRFWLRHGAEFRHELTTSLEHVAIVGGCSCSPSSISQPAGDGPEMSDQAPGPAAAHAVAAHPPLSVAITTIGVMAIAMVGSSISSQLVDLDIADIAGGTGIVGP